MEKYSYPVSPNVSADCVGKNCRGRMPTEARFERCVSLKLAASIARTPCRESIMYNIPDKIKKNFPTITCVLQIN